MMLTAPTRTSRRSSRSRTRISSGVIARYAFASAKIAPIGTASPCRSRSTTKRSAVGSRSSPAVTVGSRRGDLPPPPCRADPTRAEGPRGRRRQGRSLRLRVALVARHKRRSLATARAPEDPAPRPPSLDIVIRRVVVGSLLDHRRPPAVPVRVLEPVLGEEALLIHPVLPPLVCARGPGDTILAAGGGRCPSHRPASDGSVASATSPHTRAS